MNRRNFVQGLVAVPVGMYWMSAAQATLLDPESEAAQALQYTEMSVVEGQTCANCLLFNDDTEACAVFPGVTVAPEGWCTAWVAR